ncbi:sensor histidine kinase [Clostridium sp. chh4-2]|uniref:sensor histidine kinase n=1 Tax=Clostridium sp. chh4-2 TaxID=2067550 RepID=UPI000CCE26A1|nr:HAMP domain-containing sensor histidine kinase [Clostridium sp. chh4-2]PNV63364.1 sensor histidine kinase [Clostridium sp. chh4-2]
MKRSGYRTIFHIYLIFFLSLLGAVLLAGSLFFLAITVQKADGRIARSDWPKRFTEEFKEQIIFIDKNPQIKQAGITALQDNGIGVQLLDASGHEVFSYQKLEQVNTSYSGMDLLQLYQAGRVEGDGTTAFIGTFSDDENEYAYILYFPVNVSKITMYLNGERFTGGKTMILPILSALFLLVLISGVLYGFFTTRAMKRLTTAVREISERRYLPVKDSGAFRDLYHSLNTLDEEIKASDQMQAQTEKTREEWIANITHDLKTPLSPIKGYAEMLEEPGEKGEEQCRHYAEIMLKNVSYMESLINDLKLTYQLENGMIPVNKEEQNIVRFLKELAIDILNTPEYENRTIHFEGTEESRLFSFDKMLFTRAFRNLLINAFVHGDEATEITLRMSFSNIGLKIDVSDNGKGMRPEVAGHLFDRYYRGTNTEHKQEGSGLGLAIAKGIIELHGGTIAVASVPNVGTTFQIEFLTG